MGRRVYATFMVLGVLLGLTGPTTAGVRVGEPAPGFELTSVEGEPVSLEQLRARGHVLLVFWSTQCHVCHAMLPQFKQLHRDYASRGVTLAAVNVGFESETSVQAYALEHDIPYLVLNDDARKAAIATDYQLVGTPTIHLIAPDGTVLYRGHRLPDLERLLKATRAAR